MEQLLDPLVFAGDLKMWHHRIALKALLAQDQHSFALLYLQVSFIIFSFLSVSQGFI